MAPTATHRWAATTAVAALAIATAAASLAAAAITREGKLRGFTSQHRTISLRIRGGHVRGLEYGIVDRCTDGSLLFDHDFGFPALKISHHRFGGRFSDRPHHVTAVVRGRLDARSVSGTLIDRKILTSAGPAAAHPHAAARHSAPHTRHRDHHARVVCAGRATFRLARR